MLDNLLMKIVLRKSIDGISHQAHLVELLGKTIQALASYELLCCPLGKPQPNS
jgi:hypothetical protein